VSLSRVELQLAQVCACVQGFVEAREQRCLTLVEYLIRAALLAFFHQAFQLALDRDTGR